MRRALLAVAVAVPFFASSGSALSRSDMVPDEVLVEFANSAGARTIGDVQRRHRLRAIEQVRLRLAGVTLYRWRIADRRPVAEVVRRLRQEAAVVLAQPNYLFGRQKIAASRGHRAAAESEHYAPSRVIRSR